MSRLLKYAFILSVATTPPLYAQDDPYLWLEEIEGEKALAWVENENEKTLSDMTADPLYPVLYEEALEILTNEERIPYGFIYQDYYYHFDQNAENVRGVMRRTPVAALAEQNPQWVEVFNLDEIAESEKKNWVYQSFNCTAPDYDRCMLEIADGGGDTSTFREFSISSGDFVEDGFVVPEAKSFADWEDKDTLLVATDWGADSLTNAGYPRIVKRWRRGTPLSSAETVYAGDITDTLVAGGVYEISNRNVMFAVRYLKDWNQTEYYFQTEGGEVRKLPLPLQTNVYGALENELIITVLEDWQSGNGLIPAGSLAAFDPATSRAQIIFTPSANQAIDSVEVLKSSIVIELLDDVSGKALRIQKQGDDWAQQAIPLPPNGVIVLAAASDKSDALFISYESITQPNTLYYAAADNTVAEVMSLPTLYDSTDIVVEQRFAESSDGERIPYYIAGKSEVLAAGDAPTVQYGYGGFLNSITPLYYEDPARPQHGALAGKMWMSRGGVLVLANIRGGGEYGPRWHQAALRENRQLSFDDYIAVAEDLIDSGVTTSDKLGALGRSNGGLLLGAVLTQRPALFGALDIGVPLFDMLRYTQLGAGASWVGEYGDPAIAEQREYIAEYSPYQNLKSDQPYPKVLFYTSTKDDRVHPGHARKAAARLTELGYDYYYYENMDGGHSGTSTPQQLAMRTALEYLYFIRMLM
ncbi:prolyl oligopeptidase family serine peptidase [Hyphococcus sp.]|uniref:prolyl oligopeptidase family serine peptidase n=1 Tax=Hyphococcus sp. TaxID=2038636 RepID=UPI0035C76E29